MIGQPDAMQKAVGTGPFELDGSWSPGTPVKVKRYDGYWGDKPHLDGITFSALTDQTSRTASLESGDVDLIFTQDPAAVTKFRSKDGYIQVEDFAAEETFAMLNLGDPPFNNIHARRALAYATDPNAANQAVGGGIQEVADQPYTKDEQYYVPDAGYVSYDTAKAEEEVQAYKDDTGESSLSFTLKIPSGGSQKAEAELLQAQWGAVGIEASLNELEQSTFLGDIFTSTFQAAMFRNFAYVNPDSNYIFWHSSFAKQPGQAGGINFGQIRSDAVDNALDTARRTTDPAVRQAGVPRRRARRSMPKSPTSGSTTTSGAWPPRTRSVGCPHRRSSASRDKTPSRGGRRSGSSSNDRRRQVAFGIARRAT